MLIRSQKRIMMHISWYDVCCVSRSQHLPPSSRNTQLQDKHIKKKRKQSENKSTDWMKRGVQTRDVTNREFYELQTSWNGVPFVCSGSYQHTGSRGGRELRKNGLIHFLHERVSLGQHQTSQSTQIYGPLKQQASWPLYATIGRLLRHAAPSLEHDLRPSGRLPHCSSLHREHFYCLI